MTDANGDLITFATPLGTGSIVVSGATLTFAPNALVAEAKAFGLTAFDILDTTGMFDYAITPGVDLKLQEGSSTTCVAENPVCVPVTTIKGMVNIAAEPTWSASNAGLTNLPIVALAIDPETPMTVYAGTMDGGVFMSIDGGATWTERNTGLSNTAVRALAIDPVTPTTLYAGTRGGVFRIDFSP